MFLLNKARSPGEDSLASLCFLCSCVIKGIRKRGDFRILSNLRTEKILNSTTNGREPMGGREGERGEF